MTTQTIHLPLAGNQTFTDAFAQRLAADEQDFTRRSLHTLQLNLGKMCNLACHHCHVEAGPNRREIMTWDVITQILAWIDRHRDSLDLAVIDLTGGAPEMNPHFRRLVQELKLRGLHVLDRCNLTILLEPGYEHLAQFLAQHRVEIVASLPCYLEENVDQQRGRGVFCDSVHALQKLNALGYGQPDSSLRLDLVYNPVGFGLPPAQQPLEAEYKRELLQRHSIVFNRLWTITNMPIKRFEHALRREARYEAYLQKLITAHNPDNVHSVMCRTLVSVGWQGAVYDCDFNQMLQMPLDPASIPFDADEHTTESGSRKLWEFTPRQLIGRRIASAAHCFGCTAGAGSSCTGALS
jgi:radical SAM/Cys-rich protein